MKDYFIYNGVNSASLGLVVKEYRVPLVQQAKFSFIEKPYDHGSVRSGSKHLTDKFLIMDCGVIADTEEELQEKLSVITQKLLEPGLLQMWDKPDFKYQATLSSTTDVQLEGVWGLFTLLFRVSPIKLGSIVVVPNKASPITVNNPGTSEAYGVITVTIESPQNYLRVTLQETGSIIYIDDTLVSGDIIEINLETRKVRKNGDLIMMKVHLNSDYFELRPGISTVQLTSGKAKIEFETRWV